MQDGASTDIAGLDIALREPVFDAEITPHRSLSARGFVILMLCFGCLSTIVSIPFVIAGAWPVLGFFGLDVLALWIAFRVSFARARAYERVVLTYLELLVRKVTHHGRTSEWRFNPLWVRIETETDDEFGVTQVAVAERGRRLVVAGSLSPRERADFAEAFGRALAVARAGRDVRAPG